MPSFVVLFLHHLICQPMYVLELRHGILIPLVMVESVLNKSLQFKETVKLIQTMQVKPWKLLHINLRIETMHHHICGRI